MQAERAGAESAVPVAQPNFIAVGTVEGEAIFVWHHPPPSSVRRGARASCLCPPIGYEYMSAYRTVRDSG